MNGKLILENGQSFIGKLFGHIDDTISGEIVFQTGMVGYPESLTDPSYKEQLLVYTYPIIGNYGVPMIQNNKHGISTVFESDHIHVNALIVGEIIHDDKHSHWQADKSLNQWLKDEKVVGLSGIDTRELTKIIREHGTMKAKIVVSRNPVDENNPTDEKIEYVAQHLVKKVSTKDVRTVVVNYDHSSPDKYILVVDCGLKNSQLRILCQKMVELECKAHLKIIPFDSSLSEYLKDPNLIGIFISNGPGDPRDSDLCSLVNELESILLKQTVPVFGICLGHQLISLACGLKIEKMKYGNRGHNIPVSLCGFGEYPMGFITSQNHGFAVCRNFENSTVANVQELFVNLNDESNEGLIGDNFMSVQFHPEARAGPNDSEFLFDVFLSSVLNGTGTKQTFQSFLNNVKTRSPYNIKPGSIKKIILLGSGGLSIGQAGEFDYSGTQAIKSFKEEGIEVILINPNIATIQTSKGLADKVYYDPITPQFLKQIIKKEEPDAIALSFGGQTALNCGISLYDDGIIGGNTGIKILGTPIDAIRVTEDRDKFRHMLGEIDEYCAPSNTAYTLEEAVEKAHSIGYPVLVRAAFALGGLGSGFANNDEELSKLVETALCHSTQIVIDKSLKGWKEVEYEIVRDCYDNCISVCNMENLDPLGIHTGESIVVAPSQTLTDQEYFALRQTAFKVIRKLGIIGECNIQYALDPNSMRYYIIEVNARLSRSSALASKATGYPLAYLAGKLGLGFSLLELKNKVTNTSSFFEPSLDYCVVKVPRWDLDKFPLVDKKIGSSMKSVGEVMAISRSFEEAFQKGLRMANDNLFGFEWKSLSGIMSTSEIIDELKNPTPKRIQIVGSVLDDMMTLEEVHQHSRIDKWFLYKMQNIKRCGLELQNLEGEIDYDLLSRAKKLGFSDKAIGYLTKSTEMHIRNMRIRKYNIHPSVKQIDTVAAEFPCYTNYLYLTYSAQTHDIEFNENGIMVLGSGVYRIGSSVEFDWCAVNCIRQLRQNGEKTIMVNYNPETVSTDYDEADRLYFDELTFESVADIYYLENSKGIILSMGGQVANNIAIPLSKSGIQIYGTSAAKIDEAENRFKFSRMLDNLQIKQPMWKELNKKEEIQTFCRNVGFPCLVRPSYVLSGAAMNVAYSEKDLDSFLTEAVSISKDHPVVISKFINGAKEIEVDAVAYKGIVKLMAISEHVENAGVHSGDATLILPAIDLTKNTIKKIKNTVARIGKELEITGPFNIQFMAKYDKIYVIECNLRASRSMPFVSKVFDVNFIQVATNYIMSSVSSSSSTLSINDKNNEAIYEHGEGLQIPKTFGRYWEPGWIGIKVPQFSFSRLDDADTKLGVDMRSTGEVACFGENKYEAYLKALMASNFNVGKKGFILISIGSDSLRDEFGKSLLYLERHFQKQNIFFTPGTGSYYGKKKDNIKSYDEVIQLLKNHKVGLFINISKNNHNSNTKTNGWKLRRTAINTNTPIITNIKCAKLYVYAIVNHLKASLQIKDVDSVASLHRFKGQKSRDKCKWENQKQNDLNDQYNLNLNNLDKINEKLKLPNLLTDVAFFNKNNLRLLFALALKMKDNLDICDVLKGKCIGMLFDEPSSRTYLSFASAISRLGGKCIQLELNKSSRMKGESMEDTFLTFQTYVDAIIVRVSDSSFFDMIKNRDLAKIPIINAGCGNISHPTQALLDVLTIREERGTVNGSEISVVGDLKNSRTVKSLLRLLKNFRVKVNLVPYNEYLAFDDGFLNEIHRGGVIIEHFDSIHDVIEHTDVIYMTRLQKERGSYGNTFTLDNKLMSKGKQDLVVMHPLPRNQEINNEIDSDPRAAYFRQMKYGLLVRMAILYNLLVRTK